MIECEDPNDKAANFHNTVMWFRDKYFPEKSARMTTLDKEWMHPDLKNLYVEMTKEYFKNRKSEKWKKLYVRFRRSKRKAVKGQNCEEFAGQLIAGSHSNFY